MFNSIYIFINLTKIIDYSINIFNIIFVSGMYSASSFSRLLFKFVRE